MRRHAKRSTAAPTPGTATSGRFALALIAALCLALLTSASASAAATPGYTGERFGCKAGNECGAGVTSWSPGKIAVNEENGDVYALDLAPEEGAIRVFDKDGAYKSSIVLPADKGVGGEGKFGFNGSSEEIAIDNSSGATKGRIYVNSETTFFSFKSPTEAEPHSLAWEKAKGTGSEACGVGVDKDGDLFGAERGEAAGEGGIQQRSTVDGSLIGAPVVEPEVLTRTCSLAFDSQDNLYVRRQNSGGQGWKLLASDSYATPTELFDFLVRDVEVDRTSDRAYTTAGGTLLNWYEPDGNAAPDSGKTSDLPGIDYQSVTVNSATHRVYITDSGNGAIEIWDPLAKLTVVVNQNGTGTGEVKCDTGSGPEACKAEYAEGTEVTVSATPSPGSQLTSTSGTFSAGSCAASPCTFTLNEDSEVFVKFDLIKHKLTVKKSGEGTLTSNPVGINCGKTCEATYNEGTKVKLTAAPATGWALSEWSGACTGTAATCEVTIAAAAEATATFVQLDSDGDGVPDNSDACPKEAGSQANGCPPPTNPGGGGGSGGGGGTTTPPPPLPPVDNLGPCIAKANKAAQQAKKAAAKKKGKAKARAIKAANKRKAKAIAACKAQFA